MAKRIIYKFSIMNLILVNSVYPFDFFLRIKTTDPQQSQDSPLIQANSFECDELFPWEFEVNSTRMKVQFIEISNSSQIQIIRSSFIVENITDEDGETVAMLANRTSKKLCLVTYKLQRHTHIQVNTSRSSNKKQSLAPFENKLETLRDTEAAEKSSPSKSQRQTEQVIFSKQQHQQLSKQIAKINQSIDKILDNEKSEHAIFNKYLEQTNSFIKQMMNQSRSNKHNSYGMNQIEQEDETEEKGNVSSILKAVKESQESQPVSNNTSRFMNDQFNSWKWYKNTFNKDQPHIAKNINYRQQTNPSVLPAIYEHSLEYSEQCREEKQKYHTSLLITDISLNTEIKPNEISFMEPSTEKIILRVSSPNGPSYEWKKPIKLPKMDSIVVSINEGEKKNELKGCIAKKEFEKERVSLYSRNGDVKGIMKFKSKEIGTYSVQTQQFLGLNDRQQKTVATQNQVTQNKSQKEKQKLKEQCCQISGAGKIKTESENENQKFQLKTKLVADEPQVEQKQSQLQQQSRIKIDNQQKGSGGAEEKVYKMDKLEPYKRPSRIRRRSFDQNQPEPDKKSTQRQEMQNKEGHQSPQAKKNRFQFVSNSVSASYLPFMRKYSLSQKYDHTPFNSDDEESQIASSKSLPQVKLVNFKIQSISVKLTSSTINDFIGKFVRLSVRNKGPYITETISLSQNLIWMGKGFFFENIPPYAQLLAELCSDQKNQSTIIGSVKICLALLNLQKCHVIQVYHDYLRDEGENQIGELILSYEGLNKQKRRSNSLKHKKKIQLEDISPVVLEDRKMSKSKAKRGKSQALETPQKTEKPKSIGIRGSQAKSIVGSASIIRTKKYNGGNIIIGRAARFRSHKIQMPGPGEYEMPSSFQRHVVPL